MDRTSRSTLTLWVTTAAAWVNLGVHLFLAQDHLAEEPYVGALFLVGVALLVPVLHGLAVERYRTAAGWLGTLVCAGMIAGFVASRTVGLPGGYRESWASDHGLGLVALGAELVFIVAATAIPLWVSRPGSVAAVGPRPGPGRFRGLAATPPR